jgi:hypothetical protein
MIENLKFLNPDTRFDEWYEKYHDVDEFDLHIGFDWYLEELMEDFESDNIPQDQRESIVAKNRDMRAREWFDSTINHFFSRIKEIAQFRGDSVLCKRVISCREENLVENIRTNTFEVYGGVGIFWSWDHSKADSYDGIYDEGFTKVEVFAYIPLKSINWEQTLFANLHPAMGEEESEICTTPGAEIFIERVNSQVMNLKSVA